MAGCSRRPAGALVRVVSEGRAVARLRRARAVPVRGQAGRAVGQPRRDAGRHARRVRRRRSARLRAILDGPDVQAEQNPAHDEILVEGFIPGLEYALEGVMERGALRVFAIFAKPDPLDGPFFEETIYVTPPGLPEATERAIASAIAAAALAMGLHHGPVHAECRVNEHGVFVLEVAAQAHRGPVRARPALRAPRRESLPAAPRRPSCRSRNCCCATRSASPWTATAGRRQPRR